MKFLIFGSGVIGSIYGGYLKKAGHEVTFLASPTRANVLREHGLVLVDATSGKTFNSKIPVIEVPDTASKYDWVVVAVRYDQLNSALPTLKKFQDNKNFLFLSNIPSGPRQIIEALGADRTVLGFPGGGGQYEATTIKYLLIPEQDTMLGELDGTCSRRLKELQKVFIDSGLKTKISRDMIGWLKTHALFVTMISAAIYQAHDNAAEASEQISLLRKMVDATKAGFQLLRGMGISEKPFNLWLLYKVMPAWFGASYWRKQFKTSLGEFAFAAHARSARQEIELMAKDVQGILKASGHDTSLIDSFYGAAGL